MIVPCMEVVSVFSAGAEAAWRLARRGRSGERAELTGARCGTVTSSFLPPTSTVSFCRSGGSANDAGSWDGSEALNSVSIQ
jgi:hypothetical protein